MAYKCISKATGKLKKGWFIRNKRCKKAGRRGVSGFSGLTNIEAYNKKCGCLKANGKLKKGFRFGARGRCIAAKKK